MDLPPPTPYLRFPGFRRSLTEDPATLWNIHIFVQKREKLERKGKSKRGRKGGVKKEKTREEKRKEGKERAWENKTG